MCKRKISIFQFLNQKPAEKRYGRSANCPMTAASCRRSIVARMKLGMSEAGPSQSSPLGRRGMAAHPSLVTFTHDRQAHFNALFDR
jgi:hypothetical protein